MRRSQGSSEEARALDLDNRLTQKKGRGHHRFSATTRSPYEKARKKGQERRLRFVHDEEEAQSDGNEEKGVFGRRTFAMEKGAGE